MNLEEKKIVGISGTFKIEAYLNQLLLSRKKSLNQHLQDCAYRSIFLCIDNSMEA